MRSPMAPGDIYRHVRRIERKMAAILAQLEILMETKSHAAETGKVEGYDQPKYPRDGKGRPPAEAGGGRRVEPGEKVGWTPQDIIHDSAPRTE